jgi:Fur family transcriptional regulator, peroxide stress response regulator
MADTESRFQQLVTKLKERGYRLTPQRVALLRLIATGKDHPSAAHLYDQVKTDFPTTSLATVYKTLDLLHELGEVSKLGFADDDNRYDGRQPSPHPHLICVHCKKISDLDVLMNDLTQEIARQTGYKLLGHRLDFYGLCPECGQDQG